MRVPCITGLPGTWVPGVHGNCIHNEIAALLRRSLAPLPRPDDAPLGGDFRRVFRRLRRVAGRYCGSRWGYLETAQTYSGSMRRRYLEAERSLREDGPLCSRDAKLRAFLKAEKTPQGKDAKPRMIFPRTPRYNLALASWLKPFEHWLWGYLTAKRLFGGSNTRVVAKGLSPRQRANLIVRKFNQFDRCAVFEADGKAFEAHVSSLQVLEEHAVYLAAYHGDPELARVLSRQRFVGGTASGLKFSRPGGRASGDFNTGMGNSLLMLGLVVSVLRSRRFKFDTLVDGDNALVFVESRDLCRVLSNFSEDVLKSTGHELTLERPVSVIEHVRFGRSAPVYLGPGLGWTMVREPGAVLSGAFASHRWLVEPVFGRRWLGGVAQCELSLARGVPVLQSHALGVLRTVGLPGKALPTAALADYVVVGAWLAGPGDVVPPTRECRLSFERAFGLSPEEQRMWEARPPVVEIPTHVEEYVPPSQWFEARPGLYETWMDARR
uniref:RNA-directed RNA polymerase n=1 Tax=Riboviria sp. TaxID=2585031 RepID=A0A514D5D2_9VIRU|nr:MAG: RNA-dependent RNA polymerase [Riboviria sp.]